MASSLGCLVLSLAPLALLAQTPVPADTGPVAVPVPSEIAVQAYRTGNVLWLAGQAWTLAVPLMLLASGSSGKMRDWASRIGRKRALAIGVYLVLFLAAVLLLNLPLSYYAGYLRPQAYGLSNQSMSHWFGNTMKRFLFDPQFPPVQIPGIVLGYPVVWLAYWLLEKSPRRWWLYTGVGLAPFLAFGMFVQPVWLDPMFHHYAALPDHELETDILKLARRTGIEGGRVFVVDMSRETKSMNASVEGFAGTERIVLWDTAVAGLDRRELLTVVAHEMGHYVLGHRRNLILFQPFILLLAFGFVHWAASPIIKRFRGRMGFDRLSDIASLPLILLLMNAALLVLLPLDFAYLRHQEHEADRFALELTRDNHAAATAFIKLTQGVLGVPRHGLLYTAWRDTHPSLGDRVDFFNSYRSWEAGQGLKYGRFIQSAK